jgi:hypothetical protein
MPINGVQFDLSTEEGFKLYVVQKLQKISDAIDELPEIKAKVDKHETIVTVTKYAMLPFLLAFQSGFRYFLTKMKW